MKGILICPDVQECYSIDVDDNDTLKSLYRHMRCQTVEQIFFGLNNVLLIDEEGCLTYPNKLGYFLASPEVLIAGYAIVLGAAEADDEWCDTTQTSEQVKSQITWVNPSEKRAKPRAFQFA